MQYRTSFNERFVIDLNQDLIYSGSELRVDYRRWTAEFNESTKPFKLLINGKMRSYGSTTALKTAVEKLKSS